MFFYGVDATKKPTAAPLGADNTYRSPFLCPQEESDLRAFFKMTQQTYSAPTTGRMPLICCCMLDSVPLHLQQLADEVIE